MAISEILALANETIHVAEGFLLDLLTRANGNEQEKVDVRWV